MSVALDCACKGNIPVAALAEDTDIIICIAALLLLKAQGPAFGQRTNHHHRSSDMSDTCMYFVSESKK